MKSALFFIAMLAFVAVLTLGVLAGIGVFNQPPAPAALACACQCRCPECQCDSDKCLKANCACRCCNGCVCPANLPGVKAVP